MLTSIVGTNWGDEGKGRMVDPVSYTHLTLPTIA